MASNTSAHVEILGGRLVGPGAPWRFFVDIVEADGGRFGMWDGGSYGEAIRTAEDLSEDFGPVIDLVIS